MPDQFKRIWRASVGEMETSDLRIQFKVTKTLSKEPNTCDLKVTNLSEDSRAKIKGHGLPVVIEAGYQGATKNQAVIFSGASRTVDHTRDHADWFTHLQCGDGERVYQYARLSRSFSAGTSVQDVIRYAAQGLSVNLGNLDDALNQYPPPLPTFYFGYTAFGRASDILSELLKSCGLLYSIHGGALLVTRQGKTTETTVIKLTPESGLIGSPDHTPPDQKGRPATLKFRCLLNSKIRCTSVVRVESQAVKGEFVVQKVEHTGDSHGQDWLTTCEAWARTP